LGEARLGRIGFDEWLRRSQAGSLIRILRPVAEWLLALAQMLGAQKPERVPRL